MADPVKDPGELGEDELTTAQNEGPKKAEEPKPGEVKPDDKKPVEKKDEKPPESGTPPAKKEGEGAEDKRTPEEKAEDERKEKARAGFERRKKDKSERQADKKVINDQKLEILKLKAQSFEKLTDEQLNELRGIDPDAYIEYREKEKDVAGVQAQIKTAEESQQTEAQQSAFLDFQDDVFVFAAEAAGVPLETVPDNPEGLPDAVKTFMKGPEYKAISTAVDEIFGPQMKLGVYPTARQIQLVAADINRGKTIAQAADNLAQNIKRAGENSSPLNGQQPPGSDNNQRDWSKLTVVELDNLSEPEMVEYQKWVEGRRGSRP